VTESASIPISGESPALRICVYIGESDHHRGEPLFSAIVQAARRAGLGGATVFKGIEGYGARSIVHAARVVDMSSDLPILVEIIDEPDKIRAFIPALSAMVADALVTLETLSIIYRSAGEPR
jgi:PII-like signaling protein